MPVIKNAVTIRYMLSLKDFTKWTIKPIQLRTTNRNYHTSINTQINKTENIKLSDSKISLVNPDKIRLSRSLRITEEITQIMPYTKKLAKNKLFKVPVRKQPVSKSFFTSEEMDYFCQKLAEQGKTEKNNIQIIAIYDKFCVEAYSNIRQENKGNDLAYYLNDRTGNFNKENLYFLVIAKKKDTKAPLKALIKLDQFTKLQDSKNN